MSERVAAYYDDLAARYGLDPRAVDAPDQAALDVRWEALGDVGDLNGKSVLEVGCGYGGLGAYLGARYPGVLYRGIDVSEGLLALGRDAYPELDLRHADLLDLPAVRYDVVLAQGIFYLRDSLFVCAHLVEAMFERAGEAVAFTALSGVPDGELRLDREWVLGFCQRLSSRVEVRDDYHPGDLCFYLYR